MADHIALSAFPSCHAVQVRAKYLRRIHLLCCCFHSHRLQIDALFFPLPLTSVHQLMGSYPTSEENVMANQEHLDLLHQSIDTWNTWRKEHQDIQPDFSEADLSSVDLSYADLHSADLSYADLNHANLSNADLRAAVLSGVILRSANLRSADLSSANLNHADLRYADLSSPHLHDTDLHDADLLDIESHLTILQKSIL